MRRGKYESTDRRRKAVGSKSLALLLACVLLLGGVIGGTVAWLTAQSTKVENVFTTSDIGVSLTETTEGYQMIPGWTIDKNPRVTVNANSEDCWLFVEVTESTNLELSKYIKYAVNTTTPATDTDGVIHGGWKQGEGTGEGKDGIPTNVYYRKVAKSENAQVFAVLGGGTYPLNGVDYRWANDEVLTKPEVTKTMMDAVKTDNQPKLSFTAYASQLMQSNEVTFDAEQAWNNVKSTASN